jgi:hypothetical protein
VGGVGTFAAGGLGKLAGLAGAAAALAALEMGGGVCVAAAGEAEGATARVTTPVSRVLSGRCVTADLLPLRPASCQAISRAARASTLPVAIIRPRDPSFGIMARVIAQDSGAWEWPPLDPEINTSATGAG